MKFEELSLPESVPEGGLPSHIKRALRIYNQIDHSHFLDLSNVDDQNSLLDDFSDHRAYVAVDSEGLIQGVAQYRPETGYDYGWIEGLATRRGARVGSFIVSKLVEITKQHGHQAIELRSVEQAFGFWVKQGFDVVSEDVDAPHVLMRRELD